MPTDPAELAHLIVNQVIARGSAKEGRNETWRYKPKGFHTSKAIRHALTALMIESGVIEPDGENHLDLALTRLAMARTQQIDQITDDLTN